MTSPARVPYALRRLVAAGDAPYRALARAEAARPPLDALARTLDDHALLSDAVLAPLVRPLDLGAVLARATATTTVDDDAAAPIWHRPARRPSAAAPSPTPRAARSRDRSTASVASAPRAHGAAPAVMPNASARVAELLGAARDVVVPDGARVADDRRAPRRRGAGTTTPPAVALTADVARAALAARAQRVGAAAEAVVVARAAAEERAAVAALLGDHLAPAPVTASGAASPSAIDAEAAGLARVGALVDRLTGHAPTRRDGRTPHRTSAAGEPRDALGLASAQTPNAPAASSRILDARPESGAPVGGLRGLAALASGERAPFPAAGVAEGLAREPALPRLLVDRMGEQALADALGGLLRREARRQGIDVAETLP